MTQESQTCPNAQTQWPLWQQITYTQLSFCHYYDTIGTVKEVLTCNLNLQCAVKHLLFVAKFCGRLRLIRSVLRASKFSELKLIEIVILWFITPSFMALACFGTFG